MLPFFVCLFYYKARKYSPSFPKQRSGKVSNLQQSSGRGKGKITFKTQNILLKVCARSRSSGSLQFREYNRDMYPKESVEERELSPSSHPNSLVHFHYSHSFFINWRIIALQNFAAFCQTSTWISHRYTYIAVILFTFSHSLLW